VVDRHRHQPVSAPATELIGRDTCAASLIEHACRQVLRLQVLRAKETITILRMLLDAIKPCGKPKAIRTDNEAIFTSWAFAFALRWLGVRHQRRRA
jgi:putative transposase